jgi:hypothetical protein
MTVYIEAIFSSLPSQAVSLKDEVLSSSRWSVIADILFGGLF